MPQERRPLRGSRGFYPKKRAKRIYPTLKYAPERAVQEKEAKPLGFAGYKAGMTHALVTDTNPNSKTRGMEIVKTVSVLECPPLTVFGFRCYNGGRTLTDIFSESFDKNLERKVKIKAKKPGFDSIIIEKVTAVRLLCHTNPPFKKKPEVFEIHLAGPAGKQVEYAKQLLGKRISAKDILKAGDYLDVSAVTKGKGFAGPVKRFGIRIHGRKARQMQRHVGSLGPREPGKIRPTVPAAGQLGFQTRTELNKRILKIAEPKDIAIKGGFINYGLPKNECLIIEGSVPGPKKRLIMLRPSIRPPKTRHPVEIKYISLESKQGA